MAETTPPIKTEFNSNLAEIERIHNVLCLCDEAQLKHNYQEWYNTILCLKKELMAYMDKTQRSKTNGFVYKLNKYFNESTTEIRPGQHKFTASHQLINILFKFEEHLREIRQAKGMGMTEKSDPGEAFLGDN